MTKVPVVCFWCGEPMGGFEDIPGVPPVDKVVNSYVMCAECHAKSAGLIKLLEVNGQPMAEGQSPIVVVSDKPLYPTGRWLVVAKDEAMIDKVFGKDAKNVVKYEQLLVNNETFEFALSTQELHH